MSEIDTKQMREILERHFPEEMVQERVGGAGRVFSYITAPMAIRRITEASDVWDWRITEVRETKTYKRETTDQRTGEVTGGWNNPIPTLMVFGELTIPGLGTRAGMGVTTIEPGSGEDNLKDAESDALKRAATKFWVYLYQYEGSTGTEEDYADGGTPPPPSRPRAQVNPRQQQGSQPAAQQQRGEYQSNGRPLQGGISEGQTKALFAIGRGVFGMDANTLKAWIGDNYAGKSIDDLTKQEASEQIDYWNKQQGSGDTDRALHPSEPLEEAPKA